MKRKKKKLIGIAALSLGASLFMSMPAAANQPEINTAPKEISVQSLPRSIDWSVQVVGDRGAHYFYSTNQYGTIYRGYLTRQYHVADIYTYKGKLYRSDIPYPYPASIKPLQY